MDVPQVLFIYINDLKLIKIKLNYPIEKQPINVETFTYHTKIIMLNVYSMTYSNHHKWHTNIFKRIDISNRFPSYSCKFKRYLLSVSDLYLNDSMSILNFKRKRVGIRPGTHNRFFSTVVYRRISIRHYHAIKS